MNNCSACLIFKVPKSAHITPFLYSLHWLPISSWIQYKTALICFHIVSGTAPYLSELLHLYSSFHTLCSSINTHIFHVPKMGRRTLGERTLGERSFQYIGAVLWNSLPLYQAFIFTLFFQPIYFPLHTNLSFYLLITSNACICCVCVCVCDEMSVSLCLCKHSGLLQDGAP